MRIQEGDERGSRALGKAFFRETRGIFAGGGATVWYIFNDGKRRASACAERRKNSCFGGHLVRVSSTQTKG